MGYPVGYTELLLPKLLLQTLILLGFIRNLISSLFQSLGHGDFLDPEIPFPQPPNCIPDPNPRSLSVESIRDLLPVMKFSELVDPPESCAVCLYDFDGSDEIRRLTNCRHIFHRSCLDPWMDQHQRTCPLCRAPFVPGEELCAGLGISDFYDDYYSPITTGSW